jgi:cell division protein FtsZ
MNVEAEVVSHPMMEINIEEVAKEAIPKISILGIGGGGSNIVSWIKKEIKGVRTIALNSDAQHLSEIKADERILLGYRLTGGLGSGGSPEQGALAAEESAIEIERAISGSDLVIVTTTLGGGTGTGATPVVARIAKNLGSLTIGAVTIPFDIEGSRLTQAKDGLKALIDICDSVIIIDNDKLLKVAGGLPLEEAFGVANKRLGAFIKSISEALSVSSIMNLDLADMKAIMKGSGVCAIGFGESSGDKKVEKAVKMALNSELLNVQDLSKAKGALVYVEGGEDMTLEDVKRAGELALKSISKNARVSWGANIDHDLGESLRVTVVLAGVESPFLSHTRAMEKTSAKRKQVEPTRLASNEPPDKPTRKNEPEKSATKKKTTKRTTKKSKQESSPSAQDAELSRARVVETGA